MAERFFSEKNLAFTLFNVHDIGSLLASERFGEYTRESVDMIVGTAKKIAVEHMFPVFSEMDKNPPKYVDGTIRVHPKVKEFMALAGEGGWISAIFPYDRGGQQMPVSVFNACQFIFASANYSLSVYPGLTTGAVNLILSFGSEELRKTYVERMVEGRWQGTMALTEPEAGSSLGDVRASAEPTDKGYYLIRGQKTFISAGDHDMAENIVHLMLARIKGAPAGVKGLSLFVVPKYRPVSAEQLEFNDVSCAGCYHKMGYRGAPIAQLSMGESGDCRGWLVGEPNRGLSCMFQMMNEARINVGLGAAAIASAAYHAALEYARERLQGRSVTEKDPEKPPVPIIEHADVKRMLLQQRAIVEGGLSLIVYAGRLVDAAGIASGEEKERLELLLDFITPMVKTYPSEMGVISTSLALQCLGGYGYSDEFPLEQYLRDMRIHPIHEGTTGIQAMDLLGRKVTMHKGRAAGIYLEELGKTIEAARAVADLKPYAEKLKAAVEHLRQVTGALVGFAVKGEIDRFLADATLYLEFSGIICIAWQWLLQGMAAVRALAGSSEADRDFLEGKLLVMKFFFEYELPKIEGLRARLMSGEAVTTAAEPRHFTD
ncbi:MAG TPA: acyl-CoA dehydrogenase [Spirochaetota bacterium]|nr:acyl-CoA dehydrogenase [Spirochaetota bacterium]HPC40337.1 acyl-CoA dehydrogenase [Spirochaetota bacterium]HPL16116.1 acyl-CoA dehydrogenase [Spirochaetota bacterium]HQF07188.1 acyl-CoA dehydrogenase [Spirochaetota bacterium]HQH96087.1 acyl-CoA dehydrogenase [Spirochaetota bacterium]